MRLQVLNPNNPRLEFGHLEWDGLKAYTAMFCLGRQFVSTATSSHWGVTAMITTPHWHQRSSEGMRGNTRTRTRNGQRMDAR